MTTSDSYAARPARPFGAVGTALVTPFTADGKAVDLEAAQALAEHAVSRGNDLVVVAGTTGESPTLSDRERLDLARAVLDAVGEKATVVAGAGTYNTRHSIELARAHADLGVHGLLVVTPYYSKPSQQGARAHLEAVADATDLPVMLYDIPGRTGLPLAKDTLLRLAEHPRIAAVKDAKSDLHEATEVMAATGIAYYSGEDALNLPWLAIGAAGIVSVVSQVAPELDAALVRAVDRSDLDAAREIHRALAPLVSAIMTCMPGAVAAKAALMLQGVLPHAVVRAPHAPADADHVQMLARAIDDADGITPVHASRRTL